MSFLADSFMQMALLASLLAAISSGIMGSFVVVKRIVFIAGSISHAVLAGTSFCLWLERAQGITLFSPAAGAFMAAIASALLLGWVHLNYRQREDAVISAIWSTGMAIGVIFLAITPGNKVEMMNFLFGNILWITSQDIALLGILGTIVLITCAFNYRKFVVLCFDEAQALLQGINVRKLYMLLLSVIAITIVLLMQIVGAILVITLLTIPATCANLFTKSLPKMIALAILLSATFSVSGLFVSYTFNFPPGASIALFSAVCYLLALPSKKLLRS